MKRGILRWLIRTIVFTLIIVSSLILISGQPGWIMGWVYAGLFLVSQCINLVTLLLISPDLLVERADMQEGTKEWDRLLVLVVSFLGPMSIWIVAGMDRRFAWSTVLPVWSQIAGLVVVGFGSLLTNWAMAANRFFAATARIQEERGHVVVDAGPYRHVRHPGYLGGLLFDMGTPLALGTLWALIPALLTILSILQRTILEDEMLLDELPGYKDYAKKVPFRLLPRVW